MANYCYHLRGSFVCCGCAYNGESPDAHALALFVTEGESLGLGDLTGREECAECGMNLKDGIEEYLEY